MDELDGLRRRLAAVEAERDLLLARKEEQEDAAQFRERLVGILGHDLRTPLTAIIVSARLLLRRGDELPESMLRGVTRIADSAERMNRMISDLLDFTQSRLGGGLPVVVKKTNLETVCRSALEELAVTFPHQRVEVESRGNVSGYWDPDRMAQLVSNLVGNAITHGPPNEAVHVCIRDKGETVCLEVTNGGPPIPKAEQAGLFDPFRRGSQARRTGRGSRGLGLGLFIVKQIAVAHGGDIELQSESKKGTTFKVSLPRDGRPHQSLDAPSGAAT